MPKITTKNYPHMFSALPLRTWAWLLWNNPNVHPRFWARLIKLLVTSALTAPHRLIETVLFSRAVAATEVSKDPIFILGFPRSGTTHLHNLLTCDKQFGYVSTFQASMPRAFLASRGWVKRQAQKSTPVSRPMDNVRVSLDMPQEEEIAVANSCHVSALHHFTFPFRAHEYFEKYEMMRGLTSRELRIWERALSDTVRKATIAFDGRQLVLKSPANTGRIPSVLQVYRNAKFVHIVRNPYRTIRSYLNLYKSIIPLNRLQNMRPEDLTDHVFQVYATVMRQHLMNRERIPKENYVEVRFEDLDNNALDVVEHIYNAMDISGWEAARPSVKTYLESVASYKKNTFTYDGEFVDRVNRECGFALAEWQYEMVARSGGDQADQSLG